MGTCPHYVELSLYGVCKMKSEQKQNEGTQSRNMGTCPHYVELSLYGVCKMNSEQKQKALNQATCPNYVELRLSGGTQDVTHECLPLLSELHGRHSIKEHKHPSLYHVGLRLYGGMQTGNMGICPCHTIRRDIKISLLILIIIVGNRNNTQNQ